MEPLAELLFLSWGPMQVVADEFVELEGAERVSTFGSWAARYHERRGPQPNDLDVLVVGDPLRRQSMTQPTVPSKGWGCLSIR